MQSQCKTHILCLKNIKMGFLSIVSLKARQSSNSIGFRYEYRIEIVIEVELMLRIFNRNARKGCFYLQDSTKEILVLIKRNKN